MFLLEIIEDMLNNLQTSQDDSEQVQVIIIYLKSKGICSIKLFILLMRNIKLYSSYLETKSLKWNNKLLRLQIWILAI